MTHSRNLLALLIAAALLSACGGSGGSSGDDTGASKDADNGDQTGGPSDDGSSGGDSSGGNNSIQLPSSLAGNEFQLQFTTANNGAPFNLNDIVTASFSAPDTLALDYNPDANDGNELTLDNATEDNGEYRWVDSATSVAYVVSLSNDTLNEINLFPANSSAFLGQFTPYSDTGVANLNLVTALAGTYQVDSVTRGSHSRNTVVIGDDGHIDFDTNVQFAATQIQVIYDRTNITTEPRIQISYGADDDAEVINLYLTPGDTSTLASVQFRHINGSIDLEVAVSPQSDSSDGAGSGSGDGDGSGDGSGSGNGTDLLNGNMGIAANVAGMDIIKTQTTFNFVNGSNMVTASATEDGMSWSMQFPYASGTYVCDDVTSDGDTSTDTFINVGFMEDGNVRIVNTDQANNPTPTCSIQVTKDDSNFQGTFSGQLSGHGKLYAVTNGQFNFNLSF